MRITRILPAILLATAAAAQQPAPPPSDAILLTIFLRHDQSKTVTEIGEHLDKTGFRKMFPPPGVEVVSWYVMMGIGQVVTLRVPPAKLREVNLAIERGAWGAYRTEFYPTYDYKPIWQASLSEVWNFDRLDSIGGHAATILGRPRLIDTPLGKAVEFNGVDDALFIDSHPLAGAATFTWEVIFRPDRDGRPEQRFLHFQENGTENRLLFETRLLGGQWYLDSYAQSSSGRQTLADRTKLHSTGAWHHAALAYDGKELRNYVDGELEGRAEVKLTPQGPGRASAGVRLNKIDYFKGAILTTRMTRRALEPEEFLRIQTR